MYHDQKNNDLSLITFFISFWVAFTLFFIRLVYYVGPMSVTPIGGRFHLRLASDSIIARVSSETKRHCMAKTDCDIMLFREDTFNNMFSEINWVNRA